MLGAKRAQYCSHRYPKSATEPTIGVGTGRLSDIGEYDPIIGKLIVYLTRPEELRLKAGSDPRPMPEKAANSLNQDNEPLWGLSRHVQPYFLCSDIGYFNVKSRAASK